jgi:ferredoxin
MKYWQRHRSSALVLESCARNHLVFVLRRDVTIAAFERRTQRFWPGACGGSLACSTCFIRHRDNTQGHDSADSALPEAEGYCVELVLSSDVELRCSSRITRNLQNATKVTCLQHLRLANTLKAACETAVLPNNSNEYYNGEWSNHSICDS